MTGAPDLLYFYQFTPEPTMTIDQANAIWTACYQGTAAEITKGWTTYSDRQRREAIQVRDAHANGGAWGVWNISDRD